MEGGVQQDETCGEGERHRSRVYDDPGRFGMLILMLLLRLTLLPKSVLAKTCCSMMQMAYPIAPAT